MPELLVIGVGNVLLSDEGVGVHVVRELERQDPEHASLPPGTRLVDGGTLGLDLLPMIAGADAVVLVDAVNLGATPGTLTVLRGAEVEGTLARHVSAHQVGVADLVAVARLTGCLPRNVALVGIKPASMEIGLSLTPRVEAAVAGAVELLRAELERFADSVPVLV